MPNASTFAGNSANIFFTISQTGTQYVGFRSLAGNVGWFGINLGGAGGAVVWGAGPNGGSGYGNAGETVHVGNTPIPEPASAGLALLAMGAVGLLRRRTK